VVSLAPHATLPPEKILLYPLNMPLGVPKSPYGRFIAEKSLLPLSGKQQRFFGVEPVV
jgi:hypothetical protein